MFPNRISPPPPPALELVKNNSGHGLIVEKGPSTVALYVNQALERVLEFADRDPDGVLYKRYALLKHSDYPKGVFVLSWTQYFEPKDVDMLAGEGALFRCITQTHRPHPGYERIQPRDGCHLGKLYYTTTNPPLYHVTTGGVPDTAHQTARFYVYSDFTEIRMGSSAGQQRKPLLASVWNPGPPKDYGTYYQHLLNMPYVPTKAGMRNHLRVWIEDDRGNPVTFKNGTSRVQLHFRPRHL